LTQPSIKKRVDASCHVTTMSSLMNSTFNATAECLQPNTDISGIGVRLSFYLQTIALVLLVGRSLEDAADSLLMLNITSFGLAIAAIISYAGQQLTLYQAIIVTYLIWLSNFATFLAVAAYARHPEVSNIIRGLTIPQIYVTSALSLYMWVTATTFGAQASQSQGVDNSQVLMVIMCASTSATGTGRIVSLVFTSLIMAIFTWFVWKFIAHFIIRAIKKSSNGKGNGHVVSASSPDSVHDEERKLGGQHDGHQRRPRSPGLPSLPIDPHILALTIIFIPIYVISIASTELVIIRNNACSGNSSWQFGQLLALFITLAPMIATARAFKKYGIAPR